MAQSEQTPPTEQMTQPTPILSIEQIQQLRGTFVNNSVNAQTSGIIAIEQLANNHIIMMEEIKKLRDTITTQNTQLQVAQVEITKLKENSAKPNTAAAPVAGTAPQPATVNP